MSAPTSVRGHVDPYALGKDSFASLYLDLLEHIPDLTFPLSIPIYSRMRRDPKLSSIIQGWTLNLRRAQWQLDPAGCSPEVVKLVADGMGLAVKGEDTPGSARLRGVSWGDHLRAVLRMVPFGFSAFELEAEVVAGGAQLRGLWERPQWTISHIHTDSKTGLFTGATQDVTTKFDTPQMPARNMAWYVREREGSNWAGTSLLRPSYASWVLKEEVRRAYAIANVRWSAGVPVLEAVPGTNPTPAQMAEAAQVAQAARAGSQAGASIPPNFVMKILGITGSLPNSQEFLRWLDQQCSASALMGAFDLGESPNGSRALGNVFVDALHLALEAEAELVADVATRQIAARIVDWNLGEDSPVPRVVVSGVGSRRDVTAESLQQLLSSGALAADPALEAWVRREYRLPERTDMPQPAPSVKGDTVRDANRKADDAADVEGAPVKAKARKGVATGQLELPIAAAASAPDYAAIQQAYDEARTELQQQWPTLTEEVVAALALAAGTAVAAGALGSLGSLAVDAALVAPVVAAVAAGMTGLAAVSAAQAAAEVAALGRTVTPADLDVDRIAGLAEAFAGQILAGYASAAGRRALQVTAPGATAEQVAADVRAHLDEMSTAKAGAVGNGIAEAMNVAQNTGRAAVFSQAVGLEYRAEERLDKASCGPCKDAANRTYATWAEAAADYPIAGLASCEGRSRCRGQLVAQLPA